METKANYVLIGAFTLAGLAAIMGFFLWFARVELDRQFAYYDIKFSSVSGLGNASDVRFSGLPVGQVVDVNLSPDRDGTIEVRVEVAAETPVRADSVATIEAQGVTGVSFVGIGPGSPNAPLLEVPGDGTVPVIAAGRSTLQSLSEDAPELMEEMLRIAQNIGDLLGGDNQGRLDRILINVEGASEDFSQTLADFSAVAGTFSDFAAQIDAFNATLDTLSGDVSGVLDDADRAILAITALSEQASSALAVGSDTLTRAQDVIATSERYVSTDLTGATDELRDTLADLRAQVASLGARAQDVLDTFETTGATATARLDESQATLAAVDGLIARLEDSARSVTDAANGVRDLIDDEGAPLLSETRAVVAQANSAITSINAAATSDLPAIVADIRAATQTSRAVIADIGKSLTGASRNVDDVMIRAERTLDEAARAFANANTTLGAINAALETGDRALAAAEGAFVGAEAVINDDLAGIIDGLETTLASLNQAVGQVSGDLPDIAADLRSASQSASDAFGALSAATAASAPAISDFTASGLPLYTQLAQETRVLIANLDRLTRQIQRDPARFLLDRDTPEFVR